MCTPEPMSQAGKKKASFCCSKMFGDGVLELTIWEYSMYSGQKWTRIVTCDVLAKKRWQRPEIEASTSSWKD